MSTGKQLDKRLCSITTLLVISVLLLIYYLLSASPYPKIYLEILPSNQTHSNQTHFNHTHFNQTNFKQQLFIQRLSSYNRFYNDSLPVCNKTDSLNDEQKRDFEKMSQLLDTFRKQIVPYPTNYFVGRGIVLTAGPGQMKFARVNLKMIQLTRTKIPVQVWYSSSSNSHQEMTDLLRNMPDLDASVCCFVTAECRTLTKVWKLNTTNVYKPRIDHLSKAFPYKPAAIISSTFAEVLFLDCDAYVTRDPEPLFTSDPMYQQFGALFFPDVLKSRQPMYAWNLFNTSCAQDEYEFDSAMILVDKKRVWDGLYVAKLMNDNHELFYKHVTDGDKDTFRLAFRYMKVKYYLVMVPCTTGLYDGKHFCGLSICKTDSLAQHIYVNHVHLYKYAAVKYTPTSLEYTRIGLGDANNHSFVYQYCQRTNGPRSCFHILQKTNEQVMQGKCYDGNITAEEMEDHQYTLNEPLLNDYSKNNRILTSKTNNLMPSFVDNFVQHAKDDLI